MRGPAILHLHRSCLMRYKPDLKIRVRAENNVAVFNTGVPAPIPNNYYTVQQAPAL
jgi:hypothetical protein